ncbi:MAG: hypothetical protein J7L23_00700 [Candidatus Diapherotrites archaeon]|nr:hypothetical protein [Candidatus Diapherotrites archaeon]
MVSVRSSDSRKILKEAGAILGVSPEEVPRTVKKLLEETHKLEKSIRHL